MIRLRRSGALWSISTVVTGAGLAVVLATPAGAQTVEPSGEEVVVVDAEGRPLQSGTGDTQFSIVLPAGAACPGDSENADYRVQSFVVPAAADPGRLEYKGLRPQADGGWPLFEVNSNSYVNRPTDKALEPGGEGTIINIPSFSFAVFEPGMLRVGRAQVGIACSRYGATERYWATLIDIAEDSEDPAGVRWTVVDPPATPLGNRRPSIPLAIGGLAVAVGGVALALRQLRVRSRVAP